MLAIPPVLARNVVVAWGADGQRWLDRLPTLIADVAREWDLELGQPYDLSFNWVVPARCPDGTAAVLKLGPPEPGHLAAEATALAQYAAGPVRYGCWLMIMNAGRCCSNGLFPGTMARAMVPERDLVATAAIITVMRRLHAALPLPAGLPDMVERDRPSFSDHLRRYPADTPFPRRLVVRAAGLLEELSATLLTGSCSMAICTTTMCCAPSANPGSPSILTVSSAIPASRSVRCSTTPTRSGATPPLSR